MYESYFGLNEKPFTITPDPRYLFMSERHGEGLAHLVYGVTESGGFIQLTGEVGTGKTTLVRTMLNQVPAEVDIALILNPQLSPTEFLAAICEELGAPLPKDRSSSKALVDSLNQHLLATHAQGRRTILLVDEAQNLSRAVLEQLRLLTNLETARQKLLQIILIAQPELRDMLSKQNLRQLAQRVTGRYHLEPLSREETATYIDHRLRVAGALREIFDASAKKEIYRLSGGVPRVINVICDRSLLGAYSSEQQTVDRKLVRKAAEEVAGEPLPPRMLKWAAPLIGLVLAAALIFVMLQLAPSDNPQQEAVVTLPLGERAEPATNDVTETPPAVSDVAPSSAVAVMAVVDNEPEPAASLPEPPSLSESLSGMADDASAETAVATLFELWGLRYSINSGGACQQARAQGFGCAFQRGSWSGIRHLDRPVVLTLTDETGNAYQLVLAAMRDSTAELLIGDRRLVVPATEVLNLWFGQYLLVWRAPNGNGQAIRPGMRDANVLWLRQSLATIDNQQPPSSNDADYFDDGLEQRVRQFQRDNRLQVDGLAGHQTQIAINTQLALDGIPRLSSGTDAAM